MTPAGDKPASLADIVASATRAERSATICVAGHLNTELVALDRELATATMESKLTGTLAEGDERKAIAERIEALREQMKAHEHTFTFRALPDKAWSDLTAAHPPREGKPEAVNLVTFPFACVVASLVAINDVATTATADDLHELWSEKLNEGQRDELFTAAWEANTGKVSVPFSVLASAFLHPTAEN
jgi:hypothetical protein